MQPADVLKQIKVQKPDGYFIRDDGKSIPKYKMFYDLMRECNLYNSRGIAQKRTDFVRKVNGRMERIKRILKQIEAHTDFKKKMKVLDLGAGIGIESLALSYYLKAEIIALDKTIKFLDYSDKSTVREWLKHTYSSLGWRWPSSTSLEKLYTQKNIKWVRSKAEKLPLEDNSMDLVLTLNAIMFFRDIDRAFKEIYRVLKPGGVLYARWTNFYGLEGCHYPGLVDIPWAHALLPADEYYEHLSTFERDDSELVEDVKTIQQLTLVDWENRILSLGWKKILWDHVPDMEENLIPAFVIKNKLDNLNVKDLLTGSIIAILKKPSKK